MAEEEDEVDILGDSDYNLDTLLVKDDGRLGSCYVSGVLGSQGAELLNGDYNIGSNWLLDAPNQWYTASDDVKQFEHLSNSLGSGITDPVPSTSHCNENNLWSEKEKSLLVQGLGQYGQSWVQLSQLIGTKTSHQVKNYVSSQNLQINNTNENFNFDSSTQNNTDVFSFSELIDDMQIPASMEEVIAVVSTAKPTISVSKKHILNSSAASRDCYVGERVKRKDVHDKCRNRRGRPPCVGKHSVDRTNLMKPSSVSPKKTKLESNVSSLISLSSGEEVIRIKKESLDSDEDAEIEVDDDFSGSYAMLLMHESIIVKEERSEIKEEKLNSEEPEGVLIGHNQSERSGHKSKKKLAQEKLAQEKLAQEKLAQEKLAQEKLAQEKLAQEKLAKEKLAQEKLTQEKLRIGQADRYALELIFSIPPPSEEVTLNPEVISDQERMIHAEFFYGRSVKTPKRYLKIRNHILDCWRQSRPSYVTKTSVRTGLKHCGDVNCIGRVHAYLEQIGAINFGCEQARYVNSSISTLPVATVQKKLHKDEQQSIAQMTRIGAMRPRKKKANIPFSLDGDGGYTITHSESGEAIHTTVVQDSAPKGNRGCASKSETIKLIYCRKYSDSKPAPFIVNMSVEALLVVDLHAHSSHTEVAGLLGGTYNIDNGILQIQRALACRSNSSGVHCDMCPVSQTEASEKLQGDGLEVVGWYHSHPTFLPNPSLQDLATQNTIQQWFSQTADSPIISFILSPYCPISPSLASQFRCLTVHSDELDSSPCGTPYMFPVSITSHSLNVANMLKDMAAIFSLVEENQSVAVDFNSELQHCNSITYKQKCVESAKLHLANCKPEVSVSLQKSVVQGIVQACSTLALARHDGHSRSD